MLLVSLHGFHAMKVLETKFEERICYTSRSIQVSVFNSDFDFRI